MLLSICTSSLRSMFIELCGLLIRNKTVCGLTVQANVSLNLCKRHGPLSIAVNLSPKKGNQDIRNAASTICLYTSNVCIDTQRLGDRLGL